jgi:hypothetical protein
VKFPEQTIPFACCTRQPGCDPLIAVSPSTISTASCFELAFSSATLTGPDYPSPGPAPSPVGRQMFSRIQAPV